MQWTPIEKFTYIRRPEILRQCERRIPSRMAQSSAYIIGQIEGRNASFRVILDDNPATSKPFLMHPLMLILYDSIGGVYHKTWI